jgi:hypothetical protein
MVGRDGQDYFRSRLQSNGVNACLLADDEDEEIAQARLALDHAPGDSADILLRAAHDRSPRHDGSCIRPRSFVTQ